MKYGTTWPSREGLSKRFSDYIFTLKPHKTHTVARAALWIYVMFICLRLPKPHLTYLGEEDCEVCFTAKYPNGKFWRFQIGANLKRYNNIRNTKQTQKGHLVSDQVNENSVSFQNSWDSTVIKCSIKWRKCLTCRQVLLTVILLKKPTTA